MNRTLLRASSRGAVVVAGTTLFLALTAVPASAAQDLCVSIDGTVQVQKGTATCSSVAGSGNVAIARGANSTATAGFSAGDQYNRAVASGDNSDAFAGIGSGNTATAFGDDSFASAGVGNGNTATSTGTHSGTTAEGTNQTAIASGVDGSAVVRFGENSRATASGDDSFANANGGDHNIATASGDNSSALAVTGNHNTAIASAQSSSATADLGDNNTAIASSPNCTAARDGWRGYGQVLTRMSDPGFAQEATGVAGDSKSDRSVGGGGPGQERRPMRSSSLIIKSGPLRLYGTLQFS